MKPSKWIVTGCTALALLSTVGGATASELEQRLNEEVQAVLLRLVDSGELQPADLSTLTVSAGATRRAEFGAIVDVGDEDAGVPVLAVTPGGNAANLGLRAGDRIVAVDGIRLAGAGAASDGRPRASALLQQRLDAGDVLALTVQRDGATRELRGSVQAHTLPAYRLELGTALANASIAATGIDGCGRISIFDTAPRARQIYPAVVIAIDGRAPAPTSGPAYRVPAGRHLLTVAERIDPAQFGELQRFQRDRRSDGGYKELELDVRPGVTYRLGARFILDRRSHIRDNSYWEPVVYAEADEPCR